VRARSGLDPSDHRGEFVERSGETQTACSRVDAEFVVAAAKVLDERMTADITVAVRSVFNPRIGRSLAFNRP